VGALSVATSRPTPLARAIVALLFLVLTAVALWVPLYSRADPALFGVPFFYWFQTAWIVAGAAATAVAYRLNV
jgi:hypothetical protein